MKCFNCKQQRTKLRKEFLLNRAMTIILTYVQMIIILQHGKNKKNNTLASTLTEITENQIVQILTDKLYFYGFIFCLVKIFLLLLHLSKQRMKNFSLSTNTNALSAKYKLNP